MDATTRTPDDARADRPLLAGHPAADLIRAYRTCEFATVSRDGTPIAWPLIPWYDADTGTFTATTCVGFPVKAFNIRRNPQVSLLFSDSTGSGLTSPPAVLVQGRATCSAQVSADPSGHEDYWRHLYRTQPAGRMYGATAVSRRLFDWYYFRLYITVVPETVTLLDPLPDSRTRPSRGAAGQQARALRGYDSVVLTSIDHDGRPSSRRVRAEARDGALHLDGAAAARPGPASLLAHRHDEQTWHLRSVGAAGTLAVDDAGRATFTTGRLLPGASASPRAALRMIRQCRATTERYLDRRGLARPTVPWAAYRELYHS